MAQKWYCMEYIVFAVITSPEQLTFLQDVYVYFQNKFKN